jgi:hypothetical protein
MPDPFIQLLSQGWIGMHREPDRLPRAPDVVREADRHGRRARRVALPQAFVGHDDIIEAHQHPDLPSMAGAKPGQTSGAVPQGRHQPAQRAIPAFQKRRLNRLPELPERNGLTKRRGPPSTTRLLTSTTCPVLLRPLTTCT